MIHQPYAAGPAGWMAAALVMNKTIATKIATMSNVVSTFGKMPPATRSEISEPESVLVAVMATPLPRGLPRGRCHLIASCAVTAGKSVTPTPE